LLSSIINKWERFQVLWKFGTLVLFYKALALLPIFFSFLKLWLTNSIGCPPTFTYHGGVPFFFLFRIRLQWSDQLPCKFNDEQMKLPSRGVLNLIWKIAISTTTSSWAKKQWHKMRSIWKFWKVAHENLLGMALKYHA
jgi:hypothetical protein